LTPAPRPAVASDAAAAADGARDAAPLDEEAKAAQAAALRARMSAMVDSLFADLRDAQTRGRAAAERVHEGETAPGDGERSVTDGFDGMLGVVRRHRGEMGPFFETKDADTDPAVWSREVEPVSDMLLGLFHDLNNALSIGMMSLPVDGLDASLKPTTRRAAVASFGHAETTARSYEQLLRGRLHGVHARRETVALDALARRAFRDVESSAIARDKRVSIEVPAGLAVVADPDMLAVVLANLLQNALKYTPDGRSVAVRAALAPDGRAVRVSVDDTGIGIARAERAGVFEGRRTKAGRAMAPGTGTGLPLVKRLVEAMGATLRLRSTVGRGSSFSFELPAAP
ncbi:MAG: HAMP domain-containing sensor histidine kinase, partial [Elusimicrobiota bacterium]|nr:HAMP domain-containing sensor histidine kinase [Elusimicrobiota bacterium]